MRYELDNEGYISTVLWGCSTGDCAEYTGEVPLGYTDLVDWSEKALINVYYINEEGNLTLDSERKEELELRIAQETAENTPVLQKDFTVTNEVVEKQYVSKTANGSLLVLDDVKRLDPYIKITDIECYKDNKIDIYAQTKNMLKNDAKTETIEGQRFIRNADDSISINKVTAKAEGTEIKIDDSAEDTITLELEGKSTQNGTPTPEAPVEIQSVGDDVNILENKGANSTNYGITTQVNEDGSVSLKGTATQDYYYFLYDTKPELEAGTYVISGCKNGSTATYSLRVMDNSNSSNLAIDIGNGATFTLAEKQNISPLILIKNGTTIDTTIYPKLQKGTVATAYSEYGKGTVEIKQINKNLLKGLSTSLDDTNYWQTTTPPYFTPLEDGWGKFEYDNTDGTSTVFINAKVKQSAVDLKENTTYTIVTEIRNSSISESSEAFLQLITNNQTIASNISKSLGYSAIIAGGKYKAVIQTKESFSDVKIAIDTYLRLAKGTKGTVEARVSLIEGDIDITDFEYEPYKGNNYVIPLSQPLRSLPNGVKDTIEEDGIHRRVGSVVLDGNESWGAYTVGSVEGYVYYTTAITNCKKGLDVSICSHFKNIPYAWDVGKVGEYSDHPTLNNKYFVTDKSSIEEWKAWLQENPIQVDYELAEEVIEPLTEEQQAVIDSITTYEGTNYFNCDANMRITYVKGHSGIDYNLSGSSTNTTPIFVLKKGIDYYLNIGGFNCEMKYFDGETTSQVYVGASGLINLSEDKKVTQVTLKIPKGTSVEKTIKPQLELGSSASEFVCCETNRLSIDLTEYISEEVLFPSDNLFPSDSLFPKGTTISYILIQSGAIYVSANNKLYYYGKGNVRLFNGYNLLYTLQDANIDIEYFTKVLKVEEDLEILSSKIEQTAEDITLEVSKKYATKDELDTAKSEIKVTTDNISSTVSKKVGNDEIISKINQSAESVSIQANKININGTVSANGNFKVDTNGNMTCNNATMKNINITNGQIRLNGDDNTQIITILKSDGSGLQLEDSYITLKDSNRNGISLYSNQSGEAYMQLVSTGGTTQIKNTGITTPKVTQTSKEENKKNFEKLEDALNIVKDIDIYKYNLKAEEDGTKKHIGFVIGDNYRYSKEVTSTENDGADIYSLASVCLKAIQELLQENDNLKHRVEALEKGENNGEN